MDKLGGPNITFIIIASNLHTPKVMLNDESKEANINLSVFRGSLDVFCRNNRHIKKAFIRSDNAS